jgi:hypothetical protein
VEKVVPKIINTRPKRSASKKTRESQFGIGNEKTSRESIGEMHNQYKEDLHKTVHSWKRLLIE